MLNTLALTFALSALSVLATPADPLGEALHPRAAVDNIVYVTDTNKFW